MSKVKKVLQNTAFVLSAFLFGVCLMAFSNMNNASASYQTVDSSQVWMVGKL